MDEENGLVHTVKTTSANEHDVTVMNELLHGEEERAYGDSRYIGAIKKNKNGKKIKYIINRRPSSIKKLSKSGQYAAKKKEHQKSSVRCKVEHVFAVIKNIFRYRKNLRP